jgi:predicted GIY-YIG superfamily endonuclease
MAHTVYLLHFSEPIKHARHYLGYTRVSVYDRLIEHNAGRGARLTQVAVSMGIELHLARIWPGADRKFERRLKNRNNAPKLCPICRGEQDV